MTEEYVHSTKHLFMEYAGTNITFRMYTPIDSAIDVDFSEIDYAEFNVLDSNNSVIVSKDSRDFPLVFDFDSSNSITIVEFVPLDTKFVPPGAYSIQVSLAFTCGEVLKYFFLDSLHVLKPYIVVPEIVVEQGSIVIPNGAPVGYDFGAHAVGSSIAVTFKIKNDGVGYLDITSMTFESGDTGDFSIDVVGMDSRVASQGFTNFNVMFTPKVVGNRSVMLSIVSTDFRNTPYKFGIKGAGL